MDGCPSLPLSLSVSTLSVKSGRSCVPRGDRPRRGRRAGEVLSDDVVVAIAGEGDVERAFFIGNGVSVAGLGFGDGEL